MSTKYILLDGTSSAGKSTIGKYFSNKNFLHFQIDNYFEDKRLNYKKIFKSIKNNYNEASKIYNNEQFIKLIGIGEFSHGILESWEFRFNMLKYAMKHTNKKIIIFNEMSIWQAKNIMNNTIWSNQEKKFVKYDGIKFEELIQNDNYVGGKLWQYCHHVVESNIFLKIIKYIRKHIERISIIGIDNIYHSTNFEDDIMDIVKANTKIIMCDKKYPELYEFIVSIIESCMDDITLIPKSEFLI